MSQLLLLAVLVPAAVDIPDGSLLVLKDSNKPVTRWTGSDITHVAVIVEHDNRKWVYEATPAKVRRVSLLNYCAEIAELNTRRKKQTRVLMLKPKQPYTTNQLEVMRKYMTTQIGRRYSIKGYVRDRQVDGIHCAHFASSALSSTGRFEFPEEHFAISPAEFFDHVKSQHKPPVAITIKPRVAEESWCSRSCRQWGAFLSWCNWACYETWTFCR